MRTSGATGDSRVVRIGGASAMWGDSAIATPQLLDVPGLRYLTYDYLAETTMAILARARARTPGAGYARDFVTSAMADSLERIVERGVTVLSNAGGLDADACRESLLVLARERGLTPSIAVVRGDDVLAMASEGGALPDGLLSANAYLGARAVHRALERGADIVITGRVVDSAFTVAALVHEFGWRWDDLDRLAQATLAGHVIECGAQATGGLFTDWTDVPEWDRIGYPVVECIDSGEFVVTKPDGTGGLVSPATVAEQIVYEIGDPAAYDMPDVRCDLREVRLDADGEHRVRVSGARGLAPPADYKVTATRRAGYRLDTLVAIRGMRALEKARRTADALLARTRRQMHAAGHGDYDAVVVEPLGAESLYGPHARADDVREIVLRIAVRHGRRDALEFLRREVASSGVSMGPGTRGHFGGRASIAEVVEAPSFRLPRSSVRVEVDLDGHAETIDEPDTSDASDAPGASKTRETSEPSDTRETSHTPDAHDTRDVSRSADPVRVPLVRVAHGRSGDKGDTCNVGVIARRAAAWPWLRAHVTADRVAAHMAHLVDGDVERFELPGIHALNFVLHAALGGGGMASLRSDPLGKSFAQILLEMEVEVPRELLDAPSGRARP